MAVGYGLLDRGTNAVPEGDVKGLTFMSKSEDIGPGSIRAKPGPVSHKSFSRKDL